MAPLQRVSAIWTRLIHIVSRIRTTLPGRLHEVAFGTAPVTEATDLPAVMPAGNHRGVAVVAALAAGVFYTTLIYFAVRNWDPLALRNIQFDVRGIIVALLFQFTGYLWNLRIWQILFAQLGDRKSVV